MVTGRSWSGVPGPVATGPGAGAGQDRAAVRRGTDRPADCVAGGVHRADGGQVAAPYAERGLAGLEDAHAQASNALLEVSFWASFTGVQ